MFGRHHVSTTQLMPPWLNPCSNHSGFSKLSSPALLQRILHTSSYHLPEHITYFCLHVYSPGLSVLLRTNKSLTADSLLITPVWSQSSLHLQFSFFPFPFYYINKTFEPVLRVRVLLDPASQSLQ